jgi:hypothetical protein
LSKSFALIAKGSSYQVIKVSNKTDTLILTKLSLSDSKVEIVDLPDFGLPTTKIIGLMFTSLGID